MIDYQADTVEGLTKYGSKTYYGDATRPELLNSIGLAHAKLLIICIGNREQSTEIVEFVHRHYPNLPIIARAHDRIHAYHLHHAGANYIIRETVDAAIRSGRLALEKLGINSEKAQELSEVYAATRWTKWPRNTPPTCPCLPTSPCSKPPAKSIPKPPK